MTIFTPLALRLFGLSGVIGSILFICGDLYYNHVPASKDSPAQKMSTLPEARLLNAATLGLIGCWFYCLASLHVFMAFQPSGDVFAFILCLAFAATMIGYGIGHTSYFSIATGAQTAVKLGSEAGVGGKLGNTLFKRIVKITYIPVAIFSVMMIYGIVTGGSLYPLWMLVFLPVVIFLLKKPLLQILKGRLQELINDSYDNLILFFFFSLSTVVLWNGM